jgi:hypothetical protein
LSRSSLSFMVVALAFAFVAPVPAQAGTSV